MHGLHAATSKVVNSAQGSSCKLKFVHGHVFCKYPHWLKIFILEKLSFLCRVSDALETKTVGFKNAMWELRKSEILDGCV